jgi:OmpA-OmpF porin, OOP family
MKLFLKGDERSLLMSILTVFGVHSVKKSSSFRACGAAFALLLFCQPGPVAAEDEAAIGEIVPQFIAVTGIYIDSDKDRGASEGRGLRVAYGRSITPKWYWETDGFAAILETGNATMLDFYQVGISTGLSWSLYERHPDRWTPYAIGMIGTTYNDAQPDDTDGFDLTLAAGIGAVSRSLFRNGIRLRAEARFLYDTYASDQTDWHLSAGIEIPLRGARVVERIQYIERVTEVSREIEVIVTADDPDSDGDGVPDSRDLCPDTLPGARVDATGCIIESQTIALSNVAFELGSANLTASSRDALNRIAASLKAQTDLRIEIAGHTDSQGAVAYNMDLSQRRADAVRDYLIGEGVDEAQLQAKGYGPHEPVADNGTASGRAMNRRVEFRISR